MLVGDQPVAWRRYSRTTRGWRVEADGRSPCKTSGSWTNPVAGKAPVSGPGRSLFPWTLFKSALSSHHALA